MVTEPEVKEDQVKDEEEVPPDFGDHPPGAAVVGDGSAYPEYRHAREERSRPVDHPLGDQAEGIVDDPVTYPPNELPPSLEEPTEPETPPDPPAELDSSAGEFR